MLWASRSLRPGRATAERRRLRRGRRLDGSELRLGGRELAFGLAHVLDGLARLGAGSLRRGERILGGLIGGGLVGGGALLQGGGVSDRIEQLGR